MGAERPNILLITTDQQRFDTIHAAGNPYIRTPHLNWLKDEGIFFSRCYSDSPVCVAARATIMTGRPGYMNGLVSNSDQIRPIDSRNSLPGRLTGAGYQTRAQGKMHFAPRRRNYGFEHMELLEDYYRYMTGHPDLGVPANHGLGQNEMEPGISAVQESASLTAWTVDRSIDFLETRDTSRPFFLWTSFSKPHPPFDPCQRYWLLYQNAEVPMPVYGSWSKTPESVPPGLRQSTFRLNGCDRFSESLLRDVRRAYYACITQIDYNLGRLFARLREMKILDKTLILFTSDHGDMLGDHHIGAKQVFLEGSSHVPLLIRPPPAYEGDEHRGRTCVELVTLADVYPTFLNEAGVELSEDFGIDGLDLMDVIRGRGSRKTFFGACGDHYGVIEGKNKYIYCSMGGAELLFDLDSDPYETRDLTGEKAQREILDDLRTKLVAKMEKTDLGVVKSGEFIVKPPPDEREARGRWPGYHSRVLPEDVLH